MDFIKMIMELPSEKRSQDVVEHTEWNSLWKLIVTQGNHSENYLEQLYDYFFNKEGWVHKVQAELDGVQPYVEGVMTQPVGKAPDGSLWTYPSTESGTVPWGNVMGDITKQQDLIQKFAAKADVEHRHNINTLTFNEGDIDSSWINYSPQSVPTSALEDLSVTTEKINNGAVTSAKIASGAVINDSIANGSVSNAKLAQDALFSPLVSINSNSTPEYNITPDDTGKTIRESARTAPGLTVTFTKDVSNNLPIGAEFAVLDYSKTSRTKLKFVNCNVIVAGHDSFYGGGTTTTIFEIADCFTLVAVKKIAVNSGISLFLLTGNVEVVT